MNPFMMMFGPIGFGFMGGGCGCGVNMPYYGMDDRLTFMNFPVFRNTSMDYLLDPRLAMMQSQQSMMFGGGNIFGSTMLPMFNNFPGMNFPGMNNNSPWSPWFQPSRTETEEEKKEREAREAEEKLPENVAKKEKIDNYKEFFTKFKEVAGSESTINDEQFKNFEEKYNEALKETKLDDRLKKLEELFNTLDTKTLTKVALADRDINHSLYIIGYSFPSSTSYKHKADSSRGEFDWSSFLTKLEGNLSKNDATAVGELGGLMVNPNQPQYGEAVLQLISTWNDTHNDSGSKGLLRKLADYIPNQNQMVNWKQGISGITLALISKADSFVNDNGTSSDFTKLVAQRKKVSDLLEQNISKKSNVQKSDVVALANEFDKLYAMLRLQEAALVNRKVVEKYADKMNAIKENAIPEDIIIKETIEDLKKENITVPSASELDELPEEDSAFVSGRQTRTSKWEDIDNETVGEPEKRAQLLVNSQPQMLKGVTGQTGVYYTQNSGKNAPIRYYMVKGDKLVEAKRNETTKKYELMSDDDTSAVEISTYVETVNKIDTYFRQGKLKKCENMKDAYRAVDKLPDGHIEPYIILDNQLVKLNGTLFTNATLKRPDGTSVKLDELTEDDYTVVTSENDIYTKSVAAPAVTATNDSGSEDEGNKGCLDNWSDLGITEFKDLNRKNLKKLGLVSTGVDGWYKYTGKGGGYYRYNAETNDLEKLENVKTVNPDGTYKDAKGNIYLCKQLGNPEDYGKALQKALRYDTSLDDEKIALRCLHTFLAYDNVNDMIEFLEAYDEERAFFHDNMCTQIATEYGVFTDELKRNGRTYDEYKKYFIKKIAGQLLKIADEVNLGEKEYKNLQFISGVGEHSELKINELAFKGNAIELDRIIKILIQEYRKINAPAETAETAEKTDTQA